MRITGTIVAAMLLSLALVRTAGAQGSPSVAFIHTDRTIDEYLEFIQILTIGADHLGGRYSNTVRLVDGFLLRGYVAGLGGSTTLMEGGEVESWMIAREDSTINITGGSFGSLQAHNNGRITVTSKEFGGALGYDNSTMDLTDCVWRSQIEGRGNARFNLSNVASQGLSPYGYSLELRDSSQAYISNGHLIGNVLLYTFGMLEATGLHLEGDLRGPGGMARITSSTIEGNVIAGGGEFEFSSTDISGNVSVGLGGIVSLHAIEMPGNIVGNGGTINIFSGIVEGSVIGNGSAVNVEGAVLGSLSVSGKLIAEAAHVLGDVSVAGGGKDNVIYGSRIDGNLANGPFMNRLEIDSTQVHGQLSNSGGHVIIRNSQINALMATGGLTEVASVMAGAVTAMGGGRIHVHPEGSLLGAVSVAESGQLWIVGGTVQSEISMSGSGQLILQSGDIFGEIAQGGNGGISISGGTVHNSLNLTGGELAISGGTIRGDIYSSSTSNSLISYNANIEGSVTFINAEVATIYGGSIGGSASYSVETLNFWEGTIGSELRISGQTLLIMDGTGTVGTNLIASGNSTAEIYSGSIGGNLVGAGEAVVNYYDGTIAGQIQATESSLVNIDVPFEGSVLATDSAQLVIFEGTVQSAEGIRSGRIDVGGGGEILGDYNGFGSSHLQLSQARIGGDVVLLGRSSLQMVDGSTIEKNVHALDLNELTIAGGTILGDLITDEQAQVAMTGGTIGKVLEIRGNSQVDIDGGSISDDVLLSNTGKMLLSSGDVGGTIFGRDNSVTVMHGGQARNLNLFNASSGVVHGGTLTFGAELYDASRLQMTGGTIHSSLSARHASSVEIRQNAVVTTDVEMFDGATAVIEGGTLESHLVLRNASAVGIYGGAIIGNMIGHDNSSFFMNGGVANSLQLFNTAHAHIHDGVLDDGAEVRLASTLIMGGGAVRQSPVRVRELSYVQLAGNVVLEVGLNTYDRSVADIRGGHAGAVIARDFSVINIYGGTFDGPLTAYHTATINWFGLDQQSNTGVSILAAGFADAGPLQSPPFGIIAHDDATINIYGNDLEAVLIDSNYEGMFSVYQLSGTLGNGSPLGGALIYIRNDSGASYQLLSPVPEPALLPLACASLILIMRRRSRTTRCAG